MSRALKYCGGKCDYCSASCEERKQEARTTTSASMSGIASYIGIRTDKIKCKDLMIGDWVCTKKGFPMKVVSVGKCWCQVEFEVVNGDVRYFDLDDKEVAAFGIPITCGILERNGFIGRESTGFRLESGGRRILVVLDGIHAGISVCEPDDMRRLDCCTLFGEPTVHRLQHALRVVGLGKLADDFKV